MKNQIIKVLIILLISNIGKFVRVNEHIGNGDIVQAKTLNSSINTQNLIENDLKTVNDIYLNTWAVGIDTFSVPDSLILYAIANKNPMDCGHAVYAARVMLELEINLEIPDPNNGARISLNTEGDETKVKISDLKSSKLYPNPNDGNMQLDYQLPEEGTGELLIFDLMGRKLFTYPLVNGNNTLKISENSLKNGLYFYHIKINNKIIWSDKLVIFK